MIIFVTTSWHKYGPIEIEDMPNAPAIKVISYNRLFRQKQLPMATYIFTDFDRLSSWQTELAAFAFRTLKAAGATVLNGPAQALMRLPLLKQLQGCGVNRFQVWDPAIDALPDRFPVFLRTRDAHRGVLTELLTTPTEAEDALKQAIEDGFGIQNLMFVEYCAEPILGGVFRKLAAFRIGGTIQMTLAVHERHWQAKYGEAGVASADLYQADYDSIDTNPYNDVLERAFDTANIDYGRVDFAIVDGAPQIYEINTNPHISLIYEHPFPKRLEAQDLFMKRFVEALDPIDTSTVSKQKIALDHPALIKQRKTDRFVLHERWTI